MTATNPAHLHRVRTGARATLALGIGASLAANMLAAHPSVVGRVIAAWPPVALLVTVELLSRVPIGTGWLAVPRVAAAGSIALIAGWVSYWHMVEVALTYGETPAAAHLLPFSVDGLVVVASVSLVEITRRLNATEKPARAPAARPAPKPAPAPQRAEQPAPAPQPKPSTGSGRVTADDVRALRAKHPDWSQKQLAAELDIADRTVRRHLSAPAPLAAVPALPTPSKEAHA